ncbi:MAG: universal stress protein [Dokdonella sp.]|uniref:universal stress protein n=1 Tax=Dokdonella sp. TaxID=2291710 RepID=UPI002BC7D2F7|nr:universal stress protein [Dokdonella sp.]HOX71344.1 universal stress protein [Dokdonella sp.]HPN78600.1 universal stress protein [Dokdonella sp.]
MTERLLSGDPPQRLLLAIDLSSRGDRAFDRAIQLARAWRAELHLVHAVEAPPPAIPAGVDSEVFLRRYPDVKAEALRRIRRYVETSELATAIHVEDAPAAKAILAVAEREACDLLILGESRDGLSGLLESTLEQVVRKAPISVLAVRNRPHAPYRSLLVGTDFTDEAQQALVVAARLFPAADITLMHAHQMAYAGLLENASQSSESEAEHRARLRAHIEDTDLTPERKGSIHTRVDVGAPAAVLQRYVNDSGADLTVIGAHPRGILFDAVVGTSRSILGAIPGDVLVVRAIRRDID